MGGTSFDASLIVDGLPSGSNEAKIEGLPVQMSVVDIHVIGAGGGSIAWEEAGAMRVGPQSAGSMPGPACYRLGGTEPTVSDANLVLRRLDGANFSGGALALDRDAALAALERIGADTYRGACENTFEQARRTDREAIAAIRNGTWYREGWLDNDGVGEEPVKVALTLTVDGERLVVDLAGTSGPVAGSVNCGASQTVSLLRLAYKTMVNPERAITGGSFETMTVRIPDECLFNAREPAACEWHFTGLGLLADLFISCLSEAIPERSTAAHYGDSMVAAFFSVDPRRGQ